MSQYNNTTKNTKIHEFLLSFLGNHTSWPNGNENFHSVKSRYVSKKFNIRNSLFGRIACAILQYNHPLQLILLISKHFGCQNAMPEYLYKMNPIQKKNKKTEKNDTQRAGKRCCEK